MKSYFARLASRAGPSKNVRPSNERASAERSSIMSTLGTWTSNPFEQVAGAESTLVPDATHRNDRSYQIHVQEAVAVSDKPIFPDKPTLLDQPVSSDKPALLDKPVFSDKPMLSENPRRVENPIHSTQPEKIVPAPERNSSSNEMDSRSSNRNDRSYDSAAVERTSNDIPIAKRLSDSTVIAKTEKISPPNSVTTTKRISLGRRKMFDPPTPNIDGPKSSLAHPVSNNDNLDIRANSAQVLADETRGADVREERAFQLRKADLFMRELLEGQRSQTGKISKNDDEHDDIVLTRPNIAEPRPSSLLLTPPESDMPLPQSQSHSPSLVIGKLTVEVAPPPEQARMPERVVFVRAGSERRAGIPSGGRFGLNQY